MIFPTLYTGATTNVLAQSNGYECRDIQNSKARLSCFDKLFPRETKTSQSAPTTSEKKPEISVSLGVENHCNVRALFEKIKSIVEDKSQFETTKDYQHRTAQKLNNAGIKLKNVLCEATPRHLMRYQADSKEIKIFVLGPKSDNIEKETGTYKGQNSYGASATIRQIEEEDWRLEFPHIAGYALIPMPPEQAKAEFDDLVFAMTGDIEEPYISESRYASTPTVQDPRERKTLTHTLKYKPKQFILYNKSTKVVKWTAPPVSCKRYEWSSDLETKIGKC